MAAQNLVLKKKNLQGWKRPGIGLPQLMADGFQSMLISFGQDLCHFPSKPETMSDLVHEDDVLTANHATVYNTTRNRNFMIVEREADRLPNVKSLLYVNAQFNGSCREEVTPERIEAYERAVMGEVQGQHSKSPEGFALVMLHKVGQCSTSFKSCNP